jgi:hypothetical protein
MIRFAGVDASIIKEITPEELRVRVELEGGFVVDDKQTNLTIKFKEPNGIRNFSFPLTETEFRVIETEKSWFSNVSTINSTTMKLSKKGIEDYNAFRDLIADKLNPEDRKMSFSVSAGFKQFEPDQIDKLKEATHLMSIWLKLKQKDDYIQLFDEIKLPMKWNLDETKNEDAVSQ